MERVDCIVIGAGVIGLAIARRLALGGRDVIVVEKDEAIGTHTSSRNSEIIHAGIYYPKGSLKAQFCVAGKHALYDYCGDHGVTHSRIGKLIVATSDNQIAELERLKKAAEANDVPDLRWLTPADVKSIEPEVFCVRALWSPSTGIIDSHSLMLAYQGEAEDRGTMFAFHAPVGGGRVEESGIVLDVRGNDPMTVKADLVVNSAGLWAPQLASTIVGIPPETIPRAYFAKGNYYALTGKPPFKHPVYPIPEAAGLGVHATVDMGGQVRFGPDVEWVDTIEYSVDPGRAEKFYGAIRKYYPGLKDGAIVPDYSGIRPKIQAPGEAAKDFVIQGRADHGVEGLINLYGIESPGLTCSLAIADRVAEMLGISASA